MGMFKSIMDVFFEEVPEPAPKGKQAKKAKAPVSAPSGDPLRPSQMLKQKAGGTVPTPPSTSPAASVSPVINDKVYQEFNESLNRALESNNLPGFDFYEFHQLYKRFIKDGKSDSEAVATALTSAETMRVDKNTIIAHHKHYVKVMADQKKVFEQELKSFYDDHIKGPKSQQIKIDKEIKEKEETIRKFTADIAQLKEKRQNIGVDAINAEKQTQQVQAAFNKAFSEVSAELDMIVNKLK